MSIHKNQMDVFKKKKLCGSEKMIQVTGSEFIFQRLNSNKLFFVS